MTGYLIAKEGPLNGLIVDFTDGEEWVIGRDPEEVAIALQDPMVSRKHALCRYTPEGYLLENLSSVNPVTVNGQVLMDPYLLKEGDQIQIGSTLFEFRATQPLEEPEVVSEPFPLSFEDSSDDLSSVTVESNLPARWLLKVISGPNAGAEFSMHPSSTYILGKDPSLSDIVFQDLSVSRQHSRISIDEHHLLFIEDLGSRNGTSLNGEMIHENTMVSSQDLIALGTTSFLLLDTEQTDETLISAPTINIIKPEEIPLETPHEEALQQPPIENRNWKEMIISTRMMIIGGLLAIGLITGLASMLALFHSDPIVIHLPDPNEEIKVALSGFDSIQFSFNPSNGKLFLMGHVLTTIDKQELLYKMHNLNVVTQIDDNVVVDEYVWQSMNGLLQSNTDWQGVALYSVVPGRFVIKGYLQTSEQAQELSDYLNLNFPYLDRLDNQVIIETNLQMQIQGMLFEKGFSGVTFQLNSGELVLAGRVDQKQTPQFTGAVEMLKGINGIRMVKNFVIYTTTDTSRIDLSQQYQISGYSKTDSETTFVVINGKILSLGDHLDGMLITNILANGILLEKDGIKFRINYNLQ